MTLTLGPGQTLADTLGRVALAFDTTVPLEFVRHLADDDAYRRGDCMFIVLGLWTGMPPALADVIRQRRRASVTGRCPACDACVEQSTGTWRHERRCPVVDEALHPALLAWIREAGRYARGRRLREDPA